MRPPRVLDGVPPAAGGAVMGTGIVSNGLTLEGQQALSLVLLAVGLALWAGLCVLFALRALSEPARWRSDARTPAVLTLVAGTGVLGVRVTVLGAPAAGDALLAVALVLWLGLLAPVLRNWTRPSVGVSFVLAVATESLAVLSAVLAKEQRLAWLAVASLAPLALGLLAYAFVLARADLRELRRGPGDQWIFGGALAIAALACARSSAALAATSALPGLHHALVDATLGLWAAAVLWLPALVAGELLAPRLAYDTRRWSTVFPLGMYAVSSLAAGSSTGVAGLAGFGRAWLWVGVAVWTVVAAGLARRAAALALRWKAV